MTTFIDHLKQAWTDSESLLCVGLDPDIEKIPGSIKSSAEPLYKFNCHIVDATAQWCCAYKPQIAYYSAIGAEWELEKTIDYIKRQYPDKPVILDAKRGDIGATATMYAKEAFERYQADAVTVNPYMGGDTLEPFLNYEDKGVIILCKTSNSGSGQLQDLMVENSQVSLSHRVAQLASHEWNQNNNIGLVVGATYPSEIQSMRELTGDMPLLIPGVGAQGGDLEAVLNSGMTEDKTGLMINASRAIIYASDGNDFAEAASIAAKTYTDEMNRIRYQ